MSCLPGISEGSSRLCNMSLGGDMTQLAAISSPLPSLRTTLSWKVIPGRYRLMTEVGSVVWG